MNKPKIILLNGFAGSGKTTIARMYVDNHPLSMVIEGDELIVNIGDWLNNEDKARDLIFILTKNMISTAIKAGHDIILPYLVSKAANVVEIEQIAHGHDANFYEFYLATNKEHAIQRLVNRGTWGEAGLPPLTKEDLPMIEDLYNRMDGELHKRPNQIHIKVKEGSPLETYQNVLKYIS